MSLLRLCFWVLALAMPLRTTGQPHSLSIADSNGRILHTFVGDSVTILEPDCYAVWNLGKVRPWANGYQWPNSYDTVERMGHHLYKVRLNKLYGYCDVNGQPILPAVYEQVMVGGPGFYLAASGTTLRLKSTHDDTFLHGVNAYEVTPRGVAVRVNKTVTFYNPQLKILWQRKDVSELQRVSPQVMILVGQKTILVLAGQLVDSSTEIKIIATLPSAVLYQNGAAVRLTQLTSQQKMKRASLSRIDTSRGMIVATGANGKWVMVGNRLYTLPQTSMFKGFKGNYAVMQHKDSLLGYHAGGMFRLKTLQPDEVYPQREYHIFKHQGRYGFVDRTGHVRIAARYDSVLPFIGKYAPVRLGKRWGLIDDKEMFALQPQKEKITSIGYQGWLCTTEGKQQFLEASRLLTVPYAPADSVRVTRIGLAVKQASKWGWVSLEGATRHFPSFEAMLPCTATKALARKNKHMCLLELKSGQILKKYYKYATFDFGTKLFVLSPELEPFAEN